MSDDGYLIWIIAMAIMTISVLTVGTLAAAGMLAREKEDGTSTGHEPDADTPADTAEVPRGSERRAA